MPARANGAAQAALIRAPVEPAWTIALAALLFGQARSASGAAGSAGRSSSAGVLIAQAPPEAFSSIRPGVRLADE